MIKSNEGSVGRDLYGASSVSVASANKIELSGSATIASVARFRSMTMFGKKSRPPRRRTNQEAWMAIDGAFAARRCSVLDISAGGAKIRVEDPAFVTPVFQLKFSRADQGRRCKVSWQKGLVIGVEFC